jgi:hypothetical protein
MRAVQNGDHASDMAFCSGAGDENRVALSAWESVSLAVPDLRSA